MEIEFAKEKVFWTRKMNLKLIKFVESRPFMWNPKDPKYTSLKSRDQAFADFASEYGDEFGWHAVKERWTNIRSTFNNYLRKIKASRMKGTDEVYKVNWPLWNACSFLLKLNIQNSIELKELFSENDETVEQVTNSKPYNDFDEESEINCNSEIEPVSINMDCFSIAESLVSVFRGVKHDSFGLENSKHGQVGRAVIKKLNQMNSYEAAEMIHKITEVLLRYERSNPLNPNNIKAEMK